MKFTRKRVKTLILGSLFFFVDEKLQKVYGNFLDILDKNHFYKGRVYPSDEPTQYGGYIRYYPLDFENNVMLHIKDLTDDECKQLQKAR